MVNDMFSGGFIGLCANQEILTAVQERKIIIQGSDDKRPFDLKQIREDCIELRLGNHFIRKMQKKQSINTKENDNIPYTYKKTNEFFLSEKEPLIISPHEIILGWTYEKISLSKKMAGIIMGTSQMARSGLLVHHSSQIISPDPIGTLPLEIINLGHDEMEIYPYTPICQLMIIFLDIPASISYRKLSGV